MRHPLLLVHSPVGVEVYFLLYGFYDFLNVEEINLLPAFLNYLLKNFSKMLSEIEEEHNSYMEEKHGDEMLKKELEKLISSSLKK